MHEDVDLVHPTSDLKCCMMVAAVLSLMGTHKPDECNSSAGHHPEKSQLDGPVGMTVDLGGRPQTPRLHHY